MSFRPENETQEDLAAERAAADILCRAWDAEVCKLSPMLYKVDWVFYRQGKVKAFAEFKRRNRKMDTLLLSAAKYIQLLELNRMTGIMSMLVVQWPDGLWYHEVQSPAVLPLDLRMGGNSRGQNGDYEPVIYIPVSEFIEVKLK
jgi:hypothetical protein